MATETDRIPRSDEEQKRSIEIYDSFRDELLKRQLSNTENYDKSILTLSSAGLAISLTFLKLLVPISEAQELWLMKTAWVCFLLSILLSLIAYLVSNAAITKQLEIAEDYYVNSYQSAFNKKNVLSHLNNWLNKIVGLFFAAAITTIVVFVIININSENKVMSDNKVDLSHSSVGNESATIPSMQRVPTEGISVNSAQIPTMQAAPSSAAQTTQQTQTSQQSQQSGSEE